MELISRIVCLVGVDHRIQYANNASRAEWLAIVASFEEHLVALAESIRADLVAEEFNEEALAMNLTNYCTARSAATRANCPHLFCEPPRAWRIGKDDSLVSDRESYWVQQIVGSGASRIIFLCGDDHLESCKSMLTAAEFEVVIDSKSWGAEWPYVP